MKRTLYFALVSICLTACSLGLFQPSIAHAQQGADPNLPTTQPSPNDVRELLRLLGDEGVQNWLRESAEENEAGGHSEESISIREQFQGGLAHVRERVAALGAAARGLPDAPANLSALFSERLRKSDMIRNLTFVVIFLFVGAGLEWLYRQYTSATLQRITLHGHMAPMNRIKAAASRAAIIMFGLLVFAIGSIGVFLSFDWLPLIETTVTELLMAVLMVRILRTVSLFFLAPNVPELRLVPLSNQMAKYFHRSGLWIASVTIILTSFASLFERVSASEDGTTLPEALAVLVCSAAGVTLIVLINIWWGVRTVASVQTPAEGRKTRFWRTYLSFVTLAAFAFWVFGVNNLALSALILGLLLPMRSMLTAWVNHFFELAGKAFKAEQIAAAEAERALQKAEAPELEGYADPADGSVEEVEPDETTLIVDPYESYKPIVQRAVRFVAIISAVLLLTAVWGANVFSLSTSPTITGRIADVVIDAIVVILIADLIWVWAKSVIDKRLANYVPPEGGEAPGPEARMATLLPLLRMTLLVTLLITVAFAILSSLGVNIAPLIAGAGVLGIAIGFGAQSLVRDIVSGIFFLIDDAFRLGEYIEIGELRGTVEGISIRSLRVRHHRGMVHTIPFGELKHLTNYSRDWVIMKLEFRVPFETDLKLVKKIIKKVGAELKDNEFYGSSILQTLKSQGVRRMEEFNMVVGVKFMTKPGEQWLVRRDAYQKVRDEFEKNGIRLAERNVKVEIQGGEGLNESTKNAVAAAAEEAVGGAGVPPGPIPDEP